ncbi:hypothetical protein TNCV_1767931 [Trichonephila clavipes]|nr:hypothetical protein TNCV_1767931 [Trichonephila clavipes]
MDESSEENSHNGYMKHRCQNSTRKRLGADRPRRSKQVRQRSSTIRSEFGCRGDPKARFAIGRPTLFP